MTLYPLTAVSPERFAEILKNEPKQLGKPILSAYPVYWSPEAWLTGEARWFWPSHHDGITPTVEVDPEHCAKLRAHIEV